MAKYDYKCPDCGHVEEVNRKMSDEPSVYHCALCNAVMNRVYNTFLFGQNPNHRFYKKWKDKANKHFKRKHGRNDYVGTNLTR